MRANSLIAIALLASPAIAASLQTLQTVPDGVTSDFPYVDPASIDPQQSATWCYSQLLACETLCDTDATTNTCNTQQLTYECLCADGHTTNLASYKNTLPDFLCQANYAGCIRSFPSSNVGQVNCKTQANCPTLNLSDYKFNSGSATTTGLAGPSSVVAQEPNVSATNAPLSTSASESTSAPGSTNAPESTKGLSTGAKAGIGIGCAALAGLIEGAIFYFFRRKRTLPADSPAAELPAEKYRDEVKAELPNRTIIQNDNYLKSMKMKE